MSPSKVPPSVLAALGLVGIATQEGCFGPCLDIAAETGDPGDSGDSGDSDSDSDSDSDTGPCLDVPADSGADSVTPEESRRAPKLSPGVEGVLPADVAKILKDRKAD